MAGGHFDSSLRTISVADCLVLLTRASYPPLSEPSAMQESKFTSPPFPQERISVWNHLVVAELLSVMRDPIRDYDSLDLNDFKDWSVMDIADLKNHAEFGASLKETASFLCRAGSLGDVAQKAKEFGLKFSRG